MFCIEGNNKSSFQFFEIIVALLKSDIKDKKYINISSRFESNKFYLDIILKISEVKWVKDLLKFKINFQEYEEIVFKLKSNFNFDRLFKKDIEEFCMEICSFILSVKGETKNLEYLLMSLYATLEQQNLKSSKLKKLKNYIDLILAFENINFSFNFNPDKLRNFLPDNQKQYEELIEVLKKLMIEYIDRFIEWIKDIEILNYFEFEHLLFSFLVAKNKSGMVLDINLPGLKKTIFEMKKEKLFEKKMKNIE